MPNIKHVKCRQFGIKETNKTQIHRIITRSITQECKRNDILIGMISLSFLCEQLCSYACHRLKHMLFEPIVNEIDLQNGGWGISVNVVDVKINRQHCLTN